MKYRAYPIAALALVAAILSVGAGESPIVPAQPNHAQAQRGGDADLPADLARVLRDYEKSWSAKDAPALARLFASDGFVLPNGNPPVRGRGDIERHYAGAGGPLHLRALAWAHESRIGYIIGEYANDPAFARPGKFTLTLTREKDDAPWLIMSDMDNGNSAPRPRPAPPSP